jgi:hypothetical protein
MTILSPVKQFIQKYLPALVDWYRYVFNLYMTYRYNLSTTAKQQPLSFAQNLATTTRKLSKGRKTILFYPDFPYFKAAPYQICLLLGYDVTNNPKRRFDAAIKWKRYATFAPNDPVLSDLAAQNSSVVNINCDDVSKSYIDTIFHTVFGYSITVDPLTYTGKCVVKSNLNAQHDGKIISCPIGETEPDVVYQKLVDNTVEDGKVLDMRVPVFKDRIPLVYVYLKKNLTAEQRFHGYTSLISVQLVEVHDIFAEEEIRGIISFCQTIGLDYGELDVLRDQTDKRIYIVDANNTPTSRLLFEPLSMSLENCILSPKDRLIAIQKMAHAFAEKLLSH